MPPVKEVTDTAGFYEFRVLLFLPNQFPSGIRARMRLKDGVLEFNAPGVWITQLAGQVGLDLGGFDGRQWVLSWQTDAGRASALLTGQADMQALRRLAPPPLADQIDRALRQVQQRRRRLGWLITLLVVTLLLAWTLLLV